MKPVQREGLTWLRDERGGSSKLLADAPGVGKTLQSIAWAWDDPAVTIVAPNSIIPQWIDELERADVQWTVNVKHYTNKKLTPAINKGQGSWTLINFEAVPKLVNGDYGHIDTSRLIVDECTFSKNTRSARGRSLQELGMVASRVVAMSGTPLVNRPYDLWAQYLLLRQRNPAEYWAWVQRYTGAYQTPYGWDFSGATHLDELADDMRHFMLRRELTGLEGKQYSTLKIDLNAKQQKKLEQASAAVIMAAISGQSLESGQGYSTLQELRMECAVAKVPFVAEWLNTHLETGGGSVLVFSAFKEPLRLLKASLGARALEYHGDLSTAVRATNIADFKAGGAPVLLLTYTVGELGHNLQRASTVIQLDLPWTPKELEQSEGRAWREGQKEIVHVVRVLTKLPIEVRMLGSLDIKESIIAGVNAYAREV